MNRRIEVWFEILPGPNGQRQFSFVGLYAQWGAIFAATSDTDLHRYWGIRVVERPHPGAVQLILCTSPYNAQEI